MRNALSRAAYAELCRYCEVACCSDYDRDKWSIHHFLFGASSLAGVHKNHTRCFFYFRKMFIFYVFSITLLSIQKENNAYKRNQKTTSSGSPRHRGIQLQLLTVADRRSVDIVRSCSTTTTVGVEFVGYLQSQCHRPFDILYALTDV